MSLYTVDTTNKKLKPLDGTKLSQQQLTERYDLQEWLVSHPEALGEELLIIQKEFDGFDGTGERLDLLALDTKGQLVLIENKRDDSGRDAVWQALKYASYVAPFTAYDIEDVFAKYLIKNKPVYAHLDDHAFDVDQVKNTAKILIERFLEEHQEMGVAITILNPRNSQRIILVAGEFRKEVTNTALWLLDRKIDVKCVKVSPYKLAEQLLIDIQQIIPVPEASEYMVRLTRKDEEEVKAKVKDTSDIRYQYWEQLLVYFAQKRNTLYNNISPTTAHWLSGATGISQCNYHLIFLQKAIRVDIEFSRKDTLENKQLFDFFYESKDEIERKFGHPLDWLRLEDKISSRIQFTINVDGHNPDLWQSYMAWHLEHIQKLEQAFKPYMNEAYQVIK
ncbi:DUF4268 domain-containing protein [uncultured Acinetobacter sp.]|uniref:DUF4268 domain-containing protein n=1 Tax=uncultured Acinetobacter sp. TaxID=165433 RepID=UPI00258E0E2B|nr:DUF4268 domain-containing protein [uncultured Acinetobacter sp.]